MQSMDSRAWTAGFLAGEHFFAQCPYLSGSMEALDWYGGWIAGATNALGQTDSSPGTASLESLSFMQFKGSSRTRH
jgi:hypothetical protein